MKIILILFNFLICFAVQSNAQQIATLNQRIQAMSKEQDPEKNVLAMRDIIKAFKFNTIQHIEEIDMLKGNVALSFLAAGQRAKFEAYVAKITNKFNQTSFLNMAVYNLIKAKDFNYAQVLAKKTVDLYESYKNNPLAKPNYFQLEDWKRFMQMAAYPYYESYAEVLYLNGENKKALLYEEKAIQGTQTMMPSSAQLYTALLVANGQTDKAYEHLLKAVSLGKATTQMTVLFKKLAAKKMGSEASVNLFLDSIQRNITQQYKTEVAKNIIAHTEAPNFSLLNLNGERISLAGLKGKVVVLDFWATWCAPCIASMPAMKEMASKHADVVFLFIATQETGEHATAKIKNYVSTNKFPLNVLIDEPIATNKQQFSIATAYHVKAIPTKVIIDREGKLRFTSNGFQSHQELINELEAMISIVKAL
jgi:thiol-disulfide isomerase/thioredoxin